MGLPSSPSFAFKIPSIHDGTQLSCRLYLPRQLEQSETANDWQKRGAIVAHPYAPLGGCYDDPVVSTVGGELLENGYVVGTFNFRFGRSILLFCFLRVFRLQRIVSLILVL